MSYQIGNDFNEEIFDIPQLNLRFVSYGPEEEKVFSSRGPFNCLTMHERYILYLYYGLDKGIRDTAAVLQKDKNTIWTDLHHIHRKLKAHF